MWSADRPQFNAAEVASSCVFGIRNAALRQAVRNALAAIEANGEEYKSLGAAERLHEVTASSHRVPGVDSKSLKWLYESKLANPSSKARKYYDRIMANAPDGRCVYCLHNVATTLDHFAPKASISAFAIDPYNLVPACKDCNHALGESWSVDPTEQLLHPYFLPRTGRWLFASIRQGVIPAVMFHVRPEARLPDVQRLRMIEQFERLRLAVLYSTLAAQEISRLIRKLPVLFSTESARREHLSEAAQSILVDDPNDWRGAMFEALADDDWFCRNGYLEPS